MSISIETLKEAVEIKEQIAALEVRLSQILGGNIGDRAEADGGGDIDNRIETDGTEVGNRKRGRRKMSAAARVKIAEAQRARWAKQKRVSAAK